MAKPDIWMPLYIGDYLADTMHLTTEQHGAYLLLIMAYWKNSGPLPSKDQTLAAICRLNLDAWSMHKHTLASFFDTDSDPDLWILVRAEKEIEKAGNNQEKRTLRAQKAAAARWSNDAPSNAPSNAPSIPQAMLNECPSPSPTYKDQKEGSLRSPKKSSPTPEWFEKFWKLYPNKVGKPKAKTAFEARCKTQDDFERIMLGLSRHMGSELFVKDDGRFQPHPTTWLNQERYNDEVKPYAERSDTKASGAGRPSLIAQVHQAAAEQERRRQIAQQPAPGTDEWEAEFARIREVDGSIVGMDD